MYGYSAKGDHPKLKIFNSLPTYYIVMERICRQKDQICSLETSPCPFIPLAPLPVLPYLVPNYMKTTYQKGKVSYLEANMYTFMRSYPVSFFFFFLASLYLAQLEVKEFAPLTANFEEPTNFIQRSKNDVTKIVPLVNSSTLKMQVYPYT